mmetsp:Transcript_109154/g.307755  ORF Transcript_109154/g.307755 Transcript_109154/m.307755 type:complete len:219 (+) Transcript_109154:2543-3199(+)
MASASTEPAIARWGGRDRAVENQTVLQVVADMGNAPLFPPSVRASAAVKAVGRGRRARGPRCTCRCARAPTTALETGFAWMDGAIAISVSLVPTAARTVAGPTRWGRSASKSAAPMIVAGKGCASRVNALAGRTLWAATVPSRRNATSHARACARHNLRRTTAPNVSVIASPPWGIPQWGGTVRTRTCSPRCYSYHRQVRISTSRQRHLQQCCYQTRV